MEHAQIDPAAAVAATLALSCDLATLSGAVDFLAKRVTERRNHIPILGCILARADIAGTLTLEATDLDLSASVTIAARIESPGVLAIDADALQATLAKARKGAGAGREADLSDVDGRARIKVGRNVATLATRPADDWPMVALSAEAGPISFALPAGQFLADLAALAPCASKEETRYYLNGAALQVRELAGQDRLCAVATDGHAIAAASRPIPAGAANLPDVILPSKAMAIIGHAAKLAGDASEVQVMAYPDSVARMVFTFGPVRIVAKMIDGTYPDWERPFAENLAPSDASPALFPELLPGAPVATIDKIAKAAKGLAIDWQPAAQGMVGTVAADPGLLFGAMNMGHAGACQRKGFEYRWNGAGEAQAYLVALAESRGLPSAADIEARAKAMVGEAYSHFEGARTIQRGDRIVGLTISGRFTRPGWSETVTNWENLVEREIVHPREEGAIDGSYSILMPADGPGQLVPASAIEGLDGVTYPVALSDSAIHLSKEQVRALIGESCFETMLVSTGIYIVRWLWEQGDSRFLCVGEDGRVKGVGRNYMTRAEIESALAGEPIPETVAEICGEICEPVAVECEASEAGEPIAIASQPCEAVGSADSVALDSGDGLDALERASEPVAVIADESRNSEGPDLAARLAEIEARLEAIEAGATGSVTPIVGEASPIVGAKRTPAHERAVQRAWAERRARRNWQGHFERQREARNAADDANAELRRETARALAAECNMERRMESKIALLAKTEWKRRGSTILARQRGGQMATLAGMVKRGAAELAQVKRNMADPSVPERSSDIARLVAERDAERTANAALQARAERSEAAALACADAIEALASRVARAEAALRKAA